MGKLYNYFVRKNKDVQYEYERYVQENIEEHYKKRFSHWKVLFSLNWHYRVRKKKEPLMYGDWYDTNENRTLALPDKSQQKTAPAATKAGPAATKAGPAATKAGSAATKTASAATKAAPVSAKMVNKPFMSGAESRSTRWIPAIDLVRSLMKYDVISFDIFDTLIFRPLDRPDSVFILLGQELDMLDFITIRNNAECEVREEKLAREGHRELTITEIYNRIEEITGLDSAKGVQAELTMEKNLCYANPYMKYVFDTILSQKKRIVLTSDMYIPEAELVKILENCGYTGYEKLFISCDYNCSKRDSRLYEKVREYIGDKGLTIIHVGDNPVSDIERAEAAGFDTFHYENANTKGKKYRTPAVTGLVGSAYRGIVNNHLHNGYVRYDAYYEYGFIYGGLFMHGFAQSIHRYALNHKVDKIIFVARDGYVIKKVYDSLFSDIPSEYLLCSRISNLKLSAYCNKNDYMKEFVYRWVNENKVISVNDVIENMELDELKPEVQKYVALDKSLNEQVTQSLVRFVNDYWKEITGIYEKSIIVSKKYYANYFENTKKALVVDIGWRGQGVLALRCLEKDYWHFGCEIVGMLAASAPTRTCIGQLQSGILSTYLFSPIQNVSCYNWHSKNAINNILTELFAAAPSPSFKGFKRDGDDYTLEFDVPETFNYPIIDKIHSGILDFSRIYNECFKQYPYMNEIDGYNAYMPIKYIFEDYTYIKKFFKGYRFQDSVGGTSGNSSRRIADIFKKFNL